MCCIGDLRSALQAAPITIALLEKDGNWHGATMSWATWSAACFSASVRVCSREITQVQAGIVLEQNTA